MKYNYEIYTCNNGNPTAIITNCTDETIYKDIAEKIYQKHRNVDQVAVILNVKDTKSTFQLVNGEFCGNACLAVSAYLYDNYKIKDGTIINIIKTKDSKAENIEIKSKCDGKTGNLTIPKELFLTNEIQENNNNYLVKMNGITHLIIPQSKIENKEQYAKTEIKKLEEKNMVPNVMGVIFLDDNQIDPYIWIKRIELLQHQQSCLSGSIAALEYVQKHGKETENKIIQPTGEAYDIIFKENYIDITGTVRKSESCNMGVE